jgi:predicted metal-dependent hydrolase
MELSYAEALDEVLTAAIRYWSLDVGRNRRLREAIQLLVDRAERHPVEQLERAIDEVVVCCPDALSPEAEERIQAEIEAWLRAKAAATCAVVDSNGGRQCTPSPSR